MTDPTEIARVAAGLTRAQRELVLAVVEWRTWPEQRLESMWQALGKVGLGSLADQGVATKPKRGPWQLTPLGILVRDHILREKSGG